MEVELLNPQHCVTCGGQDGVLVPEPGDVYVHPYCQRIVREGSEAMQTEDIRCPGCGKVCGKKTQDYIEFIRGDQMIRIYEPICPRAIEITCSRCKKEFDLSEVVQIKT